MDCLNILDDIDHNRFYNLIAMIKIADGLFDSYYSDDAIEYLQNNLHRIIIDKTYNLFVFEIFKTNHVYIPYRFKFKVSKYDYLYNKWDTDLNKWMNEHGRSQKVSDIEYIHQLYDYFDIINQKNHTINDDKCQKIIYGKYKIVEGTNHEGNNVKKKLLGKIKIIDDRIFYIGATFEI